MNKPGFMKKHLLLAVILLSTNWLASAQNFRLQHFDTKNGLPSNTIRTIVSDSRGSIWIGTDAGLCRFDGREFKVFTKKDGISGNKIWAITEDKHRVLWIGTYDNGISTYDGKHFKPFHLNDTISKHIRCVGYLPSSDCVGFGTESGVITITNGKTEYHDPYYKNKDENRLLVISVQSTDNSLIFHTYYGVPSFEFCPDSKTFSIVRGFERLGVNNIFGALINKSNDTVVAYHGINLAVLKKDTFLVKNNTGMITGMCQDDNQNVWLAGYDGSQTGKTGGLYRMNKDQLIDCNHTFGINSHYLWTLHYDSISRILWVGSLDKGLYLLKNQAFEYYDLSLPEIVINDFIFKDSITWIAANNYLICTNHNKVQYFDKKYFSRFPGKVKEEHLKRFFQDTTQYISFNYLGFDCENQLYVSTNYGFYRYIPINNSFAFAGINRFPFFFTDDAFYTVGWSNLRKYRNPADVETSQELIAANFPVDVSRIYSHQNEKWFASWSKGLFVFHNNEFKNLNATCEKLDSHIKDVCFSENGNIYVAQNNAEIFVCRFDSNGFKIIDSFDNKTGLTGNFVNWLALDKNGNLLAATDQGLNLIIHPENKRTRKIKFFDQNDGYLALNSNLVKPDADGNLWTNTEKGLMKINTDELIEYHIADNLKIDSAIANYNNQILCFTNSGFSLRYNQNFITLYFSKNNFSDAEKDIFYYRLLGQSETWREAAAYGKIDFYALAPGEYEFQLRCFNKTNGEFGNTLTFHFTIAKPWWTTWWFRLAALLTLFSGAAFFIHFKIKKIKADVEQKACISRQIAELEMKALQSQMNPHFVFNSINAIQNFVLGNQTDEALKYLAHFSQLLRSVLNFASVKYISITEEFDFLDHYIQLEKMRYEHTFTVNFSNDPDIDLVNTLIPPMMLQPLIENSIKHGLVYKQPLGNIHIHFGLCGALLCCTVTDNGIGPSQSSQKTTNTHTSKALTIIKERLCILYSQPGTGIEINDLSPGCEVILHLEYITTN